MNKITTLFLILLPIFSVAQNIKVGPFLQDAEPTSMYIVWETDADASSIVHFGLDSNLLSMAQGSSFVNMGQNKIHEVQLTGLLPNTRYFYQVESGNSLSSVYNFITPPLPDEEQGFRMVAMSDMQRDNANPDKFLEIVQDGILEFMEQQHGPDLPHNLGLIIIPGDLVVTGSVYSQWEQHFFDPAQDLFSEVPVYPVIGNHEANSIYYFNYLHLPDNGTPGYEEHWWYKDYSNTRIIGLDSNNPYRIPEQLSWLDSILNLTCANDSIDFVFAQLHHPHKSELWTPGEADYTGDVVQRLEQFTSNCGKPSIHFFGHTHGYSRGQSRDHQHLWVNVATAGGAIDHWGAFPQFDYDEFSVSQDDWGFVVVDVEAGDNPAVTVKRVSRGNESMFFDNAIRDSVTIRMNNQAPEKPIALFPVDQTVSPHCILLKASDFEDADGVHGASHWQLADSCGDFSNPVVDSWKQYENWYFNEDTQAGDDLTDEQVLSLNENTSYCWRVRYRDRELGWSPWSDPVTFQTGTSEYTANLLINPGGELGITGWVADTGVIESLLPGECAGINPHSGDRYFAVGALCMDGPYGRAHQYINLLPYADSIDAGGLLAHFGGFLADFNGADRPEFYITFLDEQGMPLDSSPVLSHQTASWTHYEEWMEVPVGSRLVRYTLVGIRNAGNDNDSYFDDLFFRLGPSIQDCEEYTVSATDVSKELKHYSVYPNPFTESCTLYLGEENPSDLSLTIFDSMGRQVRAIPGLKNNRVVIEREELAPGMYICQIRRQGKLLGFAKLNVL